MTVGYYAPLPPLRTGVADYAAALLTALRRHGSVEPHAPHADVALYQLGNNQLHRGIYRRALAEPGMVVLHDAVLHHFFLGALDRAAYIEEFVYNYGEWHRPLAEELWRGRASSGFDRRYFDYPMLKRIADRSRAVVVHNPAAARMVREHSPGAAVVEIPHLFAPPELPAGWETIRMRQRLGVPAGGFLLVYSATCANPSGSLPFCGPSRGCGRYARTHGCWWPGRSFLPTLSAPRRRC